MGRDQVKQFHHAGRIDSLVSAKACLLGMRGIAKIDERYRKLGRLEFLVGKVFEGFLCSFIDQRLQTPRSGFRA